jgi:hypothetical protein
MTERSPYEPSLYEQQVAVSMLAHAARRDSDALSASLEAIADSYVGIRPVYVIAALLTEFQKGMDDVNSEELANWFAGEAQALAERETDAA